MPETFGTFKGYFLALFINFLFLVRIYVTSRHCKAGKRCQTSVERWQTAAKLNSFTMGQEHEKGNFIWLKTTQEVSHKVAQMTDRKICTRSQSSLRSLVRHYCFCNTNLKFIFSRHRVISSKMIFHTETLGGGHANGRERWRTFPWPQSSQLFVSYLLASLRHCSCGTGHRANYKMRGMISR